MLRTDALSLNANGPARDSTRDRLIEAVLDAWEEQGDAGVSARAISRAAGVQVSAIYHYFGDMEHLSVAAQELAIGRASAWCAAAAESLPAGQVSSARAGAIIAAVIDELCGEQRQVMVAWRECRMLAMRREAFRPLADRWGDVWRRLWRTLFQRIGLGRHADLTSYFFQGEATLHLLRVSRLLDRAALEDTCAGWSAWLSGCVSPPTPWRDMARGEAIAVFPVQPFADPTTERLAQAAASIVSRDGAARLTHRAVAAEAGTTLGVASHKFRTSAELLAAAFEAIYREMSVRGEEDLARVPGLSHDEIIRMMAESELGASQDGLASMEFMAACARDPALRPFAAQFRYTRGSTGRLLIGSLLGTPWESAPTDAAILSSFMLGLISAHGLIPSCDERIPIAERELRRLVALTEQTSRPRSRQAM